ncbi:MAG: acyl-CoA dehydrogenase family protein, partial [Pseudomonadota bacterium]
MAQAARAQLATHEVFNQPEPREALSLWESDGALRAAVAESAPGDAPALADFAREVGSAEALEDALAAQRVKPELRIFDRGGRRLDEVTFHPGYHAMMRRGAEAGYAARAWEDAPGGHSAHAAMVYLLSQVEPGVCCPLTMTYAAVPALKAGAPGLAEKWVPKALARDYDGVARPGLEKRAVTIGMAMTEKQGGSDVRANTTRAERDGDAFRLTGHKWFCSAPMSDAFLTLAYLEEGLTCFLAPRWMPDGARNPIQIQRLKDKLGNHANASSEIEYHGAWGQIVGEPGRGVPAIIEMVHHTRLDAAMAPVGLMRRALDEAAWWARGRTAFQKRLSDQPLMQAVLADLALDWLGSLALVMRVARAFDGRSA